MLTILAPKGGRKQKMRYEALDSLSTRFKVPLEKAEVDCSLLQEEWDDTVDYARRYLNLVQEEYQVVWWKLFNAVDVKKWSNILSMAALLSPHGQWSCREDLFSAKADQDRETYMFYDRQARLLVTDCCRCTSKWDASGAVQCWWGDKKRCKVKDTRAPPKWKEKAPDDDSDSGHEDLYTVILDDWESWIL